MQLGARAQRDRTSIRNRGRVSRRGIEFAVSPVEPPLAYPDSFFGAVYAISIWSHFADGAALRWLDEMHRIIKPGRSLVLTANGFQTVAFYAEHGLYPDECLAGIRNDLYSKGFHFEPVVGANGLGSRKPGMGNGIPHNGMALGQPCPQWRGARSALDEMKATRTCSVLERAGNDPRVFSEIGGGRRRELVADA